MKGGISLLMLLVTVFMAVVMLVQVKLYQPEGWAYMAFLGYCLVRYGIPYVIIAGGSVGLTLIILRRPLTRDMQNKTQELTKNIEKKIERKGREWAEQELLKPFRHIREESEYLWQQKDGRFTYRDDRYGENEDIVTALFEFGESIHQFDHTEWRPIRPRCLIHGIELVNPLGTTSSVEAGLFCRKCAEGSTTGLVTKLYKYQFCEEAQAAWKEEKKKLLAKREEIGGD